MTLAILKVLIQNLLILKGFYREGYSKNHKEKNEQKNLFQGKDTLFPGQEVPQGKHHKLQKLNKKNDDELFYDSSCSKTNLLSNSSVTKVST